MAILALALRIGDASMRGGHPFVGLLFGLLFGLVLPGAIIALLVYAGLLLFRRPGPSGSPGPGRPWAAAERPAEPGPAEHVLELRLAHGEINADEYLERLGALRRGRAQWTPSPSGPSQPEPTAPTAPIPPETVGAPPAAP